MKRPRSAYLTPFATEHTLGIGGDLHVWNVRLCAMLHRPDLHYYAVNPLWENGRSVGAESYEIRRYLDDSDPFEADPPTLVSGKTPAECWDALVDLLESTDCPADGGGVDLPLPAANARERATAPSQGPETVPPGHTCRTAPHAATMAAAGGHGRPRGFDQIEIEF